MTVHGPELVDCQNNVDVTTRRRLARTIAGVVVVLIVGCLCADMFLTVWRISGDDSRAQTAAAFVAYDQARTAVERVAAIQDMVRPTTIDVQAVIPALVRSILDSDEDVSVAAARSLSLAASRAAVSDVDPAHVDAAIEALVNGLADARPAVRIASAHSLAAIAASNNPHHVIQPKAVVAALACSLADPDATVRASTIASLGLAGPAAAPEPPQALIDALQDTSSTNRLAAAGAISRFPAVFYGPFDPGQFQAFVDNEARPVSQDAERETRRK
jgi:hypothetical protein